MVEGLVSIIMPAYNALATIDAAVSSALGQTYTDIELLIVDDGSTDGTLDHLRALGLPDNVRCLSQPNQGAPAARNRAMAEARGEFLLFADADDTMKPHLVERYVSALREHPKAAYAYCDFAIRTLDTSFRDNVFESITFDASALRESNYISVCTLVRAELCPTWDPGIRSLQDWDVWLTMLDRGRVGVHVREVLFEALDRKDSITRAWSRNNYSEALANVKSKHQRIAAVLIGGEGTKWAERAFTEGGVDLTVYSMPPATDGDPPPFAALSTLGASYDYLAVCAPGNLELGDCWLREALRVSLYCGGDVTLSVGARPSADDLPPHAMSGHMLGHEIRLEATPTGAVVVVPSSVVRGLALGPDAPWDDIVEWLRERAASSEGLCLGLRLRPASALPCVRPAVVGFTQYPAGQREAESEPSLARPTPRVGFVTLWFERGAAYVTRTLRQVAAERFETFVFARTGRVGTPDGIINALDTDGEWAVPNLTTHPEYDIPGETLQRWIADNQLDAVVFNEEYDWDLVHACKAMGCKAVTYLDFYDDRWKDSLPVFDAVLCSTWRTYDLVHDHCNAHFIGWAIPADVFAPSPDQATHTFFHSAGWHGINYRKNTPAVVAAFDELSIRDLDATLLIHAQLPLRHLPAETVSMIERNPRIDYLEATVPAPGLYHRGRVYVYPAKLDGLGLSLLEALSCGLPAVATDAAPWNEFVHEGLNGLLVDVAERVARPDGVAFPETLVDTADLVRRMREIVQDPTRLEHMAAQARAAALEQLDGESFARAVLAVLGAVVNWGGWIFSGDYGVGSGCSTEGYVRTFQTPWPAPGAPTVLPATGVFDSHEYWRTRHESLRGDIRAVGNLDWTEDANRVVYEMRLNKLAEAVGLTGVDLCESRVLDAGCGVGLISEWLCQRGAQVVGIDISPVAVEQAHGRCPEGSFFATPIDNFTDPAGFDCVLCIDVLYHLTDPAVWRASLAALARATRPGGALILVDVIADVERHWGHGVFRTWGEYAAELSGLGVREIGRVAYDYGVLDSIEGAERPSDTATIIVLERLGTEPGAARKSQPAPSSA